MPRPPSGPAGQTTSPLSRRQVRRPLACRDPQIFIDLSCPLVTNLEAVVIQLQDSCRAAKNEAAELRDQNQRLKQEAKQRDRLLRKLMHGKGSDGHDGPSDDYTPAPPYSVHAPSGVVGPSMNSLHPSHYADDALRYPTGTDQSAAMAGASYHPGNGQDFPQRSPALTFANTVDHDVSGDSRPHHLDSHRMTRYDQYYSMDGSARDGPWAGASDAGALDSGSSSHSPSFVESPNLTSADLSYSSRFPVVEDQKIPLAPLGSSSYIFPTSRSLSPAASTPTSTSSTSLAPTPFQFTFPENNVVQERPDFHNYRRHNHGPELTLHGGTADISSLTAPGGDALRYRLSGGRAHAASDRPMAQALSSYSRTENGSGGRESDESESASYTYSTRSRQRSGVSSARASRSPSPGPPPICGTLAVIKAQAFGALRRTRTRTKKSSEGAAKAAVEALEARGIGMGITVGSATKRQRLHSDDGDLN